VIEVEMMFKEDMASVIEVELEHFSARAGSDRLAWGEAEYENAVAEANQLALVARKGMDRRAVGAMVYGRPSEFDGFDVLRLVAHPRYEDDYDIRRALLGYMANFAHEDDRRRTLRVYVHGDDLDTIRLMQQLGAPHVRLKDRDDTWLYTLKTDKES
jgi:ribosomal protein S18 acetylase RimI-like enzyme